MSESTRRRGRQYVLTPEEIQQVHELRLRGMTYREVGEEMGINYVSAWRAFNFSVPGVPATYRLVDAKLKL